MIYGTSAEYTHARSSILAVKIDCRPAHQIKPGYFSIIRTALLRALRYRFRGARSLKFFYPTRRHFTDTRGRKAREISHQLLKARNTHKMIVSSWRYGCR